MTRAPFAMACPQCGRKAPSDATNPCRPFCSEKCRLLDLGAWLNGDYRIPDPGDGATDESPSTTSGEGGTGSPT